MSLAKATHNKQAKGALDNEIREELGDVEDYVARRERGGAEQR